MDPLSVAASVVGLIAAGAQLIPQLYNLSSAIKDAPQHARAAVSELGDITIVLTQLQKYIDGRAQASIQRLNLITVEHITASLTECVLTYSELDAVLKALHTEQGMKVWDRAVWFVKKDEVNQIIVRLQNHKSTFGLMLNIIQCASMNEAENNMDKLCDMVNELLQSNKGLWLKLRNMEETISRQGPGGVAAGTSEQQANTGAAVSALPGDQTSKSPTSSRSRSVISGGAASPSPRISAEIEEPQPKTSAFEELLHRSRVYRHAAGRHSDSSLIDDGRSSLAISICSSMTLGEVSRISVYALPVYANELSNPQCYEFKRQQAPDPRPSSQQTQQFPAKTVGASPERTTENNSRLRIWWKRTRQSGQTRMEVPRDEPPVFGIALEISIRYANVAISLYNEDGQHYIYGYIPILIGKCGVILKEKGTDVKDIFEQAGSPKRLQELRVIFDSPPRYGGGVDWTEYTVFDAANLLLRYLLQLPEPVIPSLFFERFHNPINALALLPETLSEDAIIYYQSLIVELPPLSRQLLLYILDLLAVFASKSDVNNMTAPKLAALFQPAILNHPDHRLDVSKMATSQTALIFLIDNQDYFLIGMAAPTDSDGTAKDADGNVGNTSGS